MSETTYKINIHKISVQSNRLLLFTTPKMIFYDCWRNELFRLQFTSKYIHMNTDGAYNPDKV